MQTRPTIMPIAHPGNFDDRLQPSEVVSCDTSKVIDNALCVYLVTGFTYQKDFVTCAAK